MSRASARACPKHDPMQQTRNRRRRGPAAGMRRTGIGSMPRTARDIWPTRGAAMHSGPLGGARIPSACGSSRQPIAPPSRGGALSGPIVVPSRTSIGTARPAVWLTTSFRCAANMSAGCTCRGIFSIYQSHEHQEEQPLGVWRLKSAPCLVRTSHDPIRTPRADRDAGGLIDRLLALRRRSRRRAVATAR